MLDTSKLLKNMYIRTSVHCLLLRLDYKSIVYDFFFFVLSKMTTF